MMQQAEHAEAQRLMKDVKVVSLGAIGQARRDQEYAAAQAAIHVALAANVSEKAIFNRIHDGERGWPSEKIGALVPRAEAATKREQSMINITKGETSKPRHNYTQDVTNKVIAMMEGEGLKPWEVSWDRGLTKAFNPYTREKSQGQGREYRGANALNLLIAQLARDSSDPRWLTFNQAKDAGLSVRKGARAEAVMYWQFPDANAKEAKWNAGDSRPSATGVFRLKDGKYAAYDVKGWMKEADTFDEARTMTIRGSRFRSADRFQWAAVEDAEATARNDRPKPFFALVFNGADIVGMPPMKERRVFNANERAERLIQATGAVIEHRELTRVGQGALVNHAFYNSAEDKITVPPRGHFKSEGDYYRTVIHEIAHWTGHESRLNRGLDEAKRGTPEYAWEELRAEMASAMICAALGVDGGLEDHAAYLDEYVKLLKSDRSAVFKAARDAEKIYEAVFDADPELRAEVHGHLSDNRLTTPDPGAKKNQTFDLKKIIKGDLPNFTPVKPVAVQPDFVPTLPSPLEPTPEVTNPQESQVVVPEVPRHVDIEIDFGDLRLNGDAETRLISGFVAAADLDDEIEIEGFEPVAALDDDFADIEVGPMP